MNLVGQVLKRIGTEMPCMWNRSTRLWVLSRMFTRQDVVFFGGVSRFAVVPIFLINKVDLE